MMCSSFTLSSLAIAYTATIEQLLSRIQSRYRILTYPGKVYFIFKVLSTMCSSEVIMRASSVRFGLAEPHELSLDNQALNVLY